ncbi:zinc ribbon domain-containing protein [Planctomicrobium sp. SH668]|uniref:zinc ribbon domain-containing protein n=1 Tax=Planctomicrobium sp. SH668 TaxID=3448126 RepID=UPI003F5CB6BE
MASAGAQYSYLHQLLIQLKDVQDQLARGPKQVKARQKRLAEFEKDLVEKEAEFKETRATTDRKNLDLKSKESHLVDLQGKLNQAASNREFDIIKGQMAADRAAKAVLEDEIIEWLDRTDSLQRSIAEAKQAILDYQADSKKMAADFEERSGGYRQEEEKLKVRISEAETVIPTELREQYRRLVEAYGADAFASVQNNVCGQCRVSITAQFRVHLNGGKLMTCGICGRLLYLGE